MIKHSVAMALLVAPLPVLTTPAHAAPPAQQRQFDIPAQRLSAALETFSRQAGLQILFPYDKADARRSPAVRGPMTPRAALDLLLAGSDLEVATLTSDRVTIRASRRSPAAPAAQVGEASPSGDIVVTAQRYEQPSRQVPFALTALSAETLKERRVQTLNDVALYTPGLHIDTQSPNNPAFVMRGINSSGGDSYTEPRVSVFQDGVSISKSRGSFVELFDIERIEVAKGPQSTLFGRGALIGGINIIQHRADPEFKWSMAGEYGSHDYFLVEPMVNVPLGEAVALRVTGRHRERSGYMENLSPGADGDLNGYRTDAIRGTLSVRPGNGFSADLIVNYQRDRTDGTGFKSMYFNQTDPATGAVVAGTSKDEGAWLQSPADFAGGRALGVDQDYVGITGLMSYQFSPSLTLKSITGWRDVNSIEVYDADGISLPVFASMEDNGGRYFSQELRLRWDDGGVFAGSVGANYYRERARSAVTNRFNERMLLAQVTGMLGGGGGDAFTPAPAAMFDNTAFTGALVNAVAQASSGGKLILGNAEAAAVAARFNPAHTETGRNRSDVDSWDLFADMTLRPAPGLEVSGGLRYTDDRRTTHWSSSIMGRSGLAALTVASGLAADESAEGIANARALLAGLAAYGSDLSAPLPLLGINVQPTANNGDFSSDSLDSGGLTWRIAATYAATDTTNVYGSYGRGRRAAVLSASAPGTPGGLPKFTVAPAEKVDAFEIGVKSDIRSAGLRFDVSTYYYEYKNFQTQTLVGPIMVTTNAGRARAYGAEFQMNWRVVRGLELFGNYAYNHARFTTGAYDGNYFTRAPEHMFAIGASAEYPAAGGSFYVRPTYSYQSRIFFSDDNDLPQFQTSRAVPDTIQDEFQRGYGIVNLQLGYTPDNERWRIELFARNLTDQTYRIGAGSAGETIGMPTNVIGEPRIVGIRLSLGN